MCQRNAKESSARKEAMNGLMRESVFLFGLSCTFSSFVALFAYLNTCAEQRVCLDANTCRKPHASSKDEFSCSFVSISSHAGYKMVMGDWNGNPKRNGGAGDGDGSNGSNNTSLAVWNGDETSLQQYYEHKQKLLDKLQRTALRGVCAPGLRQVLSSCVRFRSYPSALVDEIRLVAPDTGIASSYDHYYHFNGNGDGNGDGGGNGGGNGGGLFPHEAWCGRWIRASSMHIASMTTSYKMWSFFDESSTRLALEQIVATRGSPALSVHDLEKFRLSCRNMLTTQSLASQSESAFMLVLDRIGFEIVLEANAAAAVAVKAYQDTEDSQWFQTQQQHTAGPSSSSSSSFAHAASSAVDSAHEASLNALGALTSMYCDAPVRVGLSIDTSRGGRLVMQVTNAEFFDMTDEDTVRADLYSVGMHRSERDAAARFATVFREELETFANLQSLEHRSSSSYWVWPTSKIASAVLGGAISDATRTYAAAASGFTSGSGALRRPSMVYESKLGGLQAFLSARMRTSAIEQNAYIKALAARCALAVRDVAMLTPPNSKSRASEPMSTPFGQVDTVSSASTSQSSSFALGRVLITNRFSILNETHLFSSSVGGWNALRTSSSSSLSSLSAISGRSLSSHDQYVTDTCTRVARMAFPDEFDQLSYSELVTRNLHDRIDAMTERLRAAVSNVIRSDPIRSVFLHARDLDGVVSALEGASVRIAGSQRRNRVFLKPSFSSSDGALRMLLKQAQAVFADRVISVSKQESVCTTPPLMDSTSRNAYLLMAGSHRCATLLPGLVVPPFADERYDDASLYTHLGFVVAHELAHVTSLEHLWDSAYVDALLGPYYLDSPHTYSEALADVIAMLSIRNLNVLDGDDDLLCGHMSQLWCAQTPESAEVSNLLSALWTSKQEQQKQKQRHSEHPLPNHRGDALCAFLKAFGVSFHSGDDKTTKA
jgi:hypothetical protein